jgi:hypothetical protein
MYLRGLSGRLLALMLLSSPLLAGASDSIVVPPAVREFASPSGAFTLRISSADNWKTPVAAAELDALNSGASKVVWRRELPHHYGPRKALVSDQGDALLVDEWINILSRYALTVVDRNNRIVAQYAADDIFAVLGIPARDVSALAREGPWLSAGPTLSTDGKLALIETGACTLEIRLADGRLSARHQPKP